jgi:endonuclease YncB( thermonuclease family)
MRALIAALALWTATALAFTGRVVAIADGDTLTVMDGKAAVRVRLAGIDAPEHGQPYGRKARTSLAELAHRKTVEVDERGRDTYGRTLAVVRVDGIELNAEQVRRGYAWVYRRYSNDSALIALEAEARAARRGLWQDAAPVPPWNWRRSPADSPPGGASRTMWAP